jgi:hypothetical protein
VCAIPQAVNAFIGALSVVAAIENAQSLNSTLVVSAMRALNFTEFYGRLVSPQASVTWSIPECCLLSPLYCRERRGSPTWLSSVAGCSWKR